MRALTCPDTAAKIVALLKRGNDNDTSEDHRHHNRHHPEYLVLWALPVLARPIDPFYRHSFSCAYHQDSLQSFCLNQGVCVSIRSDRLARARIIDSVLSW